MNEEQVDFFDRLLVLQREAAKLAEDLPPGPLKSRAQHIAVVASLLKARLDVFSSVILPPKGTPDQR